jgi:cytidylate kinase
MHQIITISGDPGSGKSTIAQELAKKLKAKRIYVGEIRREIARKKGLTLAELNKYAEKHPETDVDIERLLAKLNY